MLQYLWILEELQTHLYIIRIERDRKHQKQNKSVIKYPRSIETDGGRNRGN